MADEKPKMVVAIGTEAAAAAIIDALDLKPGDTVRIVTPQFTRPPGSPVPGDPPATLEGWDALRKLTKAELLALGFGNWDGRLMLIPGEWHKLLPVGLLVESIDGPEDTHMVGADDIDDDIRFGCLAYGIPAVDGVAEKSRMAYKRIEVRDGRGVVVHEEPGPEHDEEDR